jgi:hypothetical protein
MKDNLEKFILENREAFDDQEPNPLLWLEIEKKLPAKKIVPVRKITRIFAVAASIIVILGVGMLIGLNLDQGNANNLPVANEQYAEFQEAEQYFQKQVNVKMGELKQHSVDEDVEKDLTQLDAVYNEMKAELLNSTNKDNNAIIEAMIENYRIRIEMLEKILNNVKDKNETHEENISI